jgi:hypothetical protein
MWNSTRKKGSTRAFSYQYMPSENVLPYVSTRNRSNAWRQGLRVAGFLF